MQDLPISYEQMRTLLLKYLTRALSGQLAELPEGVAKIAIDRGLLLEGPASKRGSLLGYGDRPRISAKDFARVQSILWDLIIEGIVRPGLNDGANDAFPFFHVTERGKELLKGGSPSPYDPDGYLTRLKNVVPILDDIIITYLEESLHTFRIGCLLSSTIALGCASEKAFLLLVEAYGNALQGNSQAKFRDKIRGKMIKTIFDEFSSRSESHLQPRLPSEIAADLDVTLNGVFTLIRNQRNEAGHPTGRKVEREQANLNLAVFPGYVKKVYQVMEWIRTNAPLT